MQKYASKFHEIFKKMGKFAWKNNSTKISSEHFELHEYAKFYLHSNRKKYVSLRFKCRRKKNTRALYKVKKNDVVKTK